MSSSKSIDEENFPIEKNSNLPLESDRKNLLKILNELEKRHVNLSSENHLLSSAIGEFFSQKNVTRAFHKLTNNENDNCIKNYFSSMENLCKIKQKQRILQQENEEQKSMVHKEIDAAVTELEENKNGKSL